MNRTIYSVGHGARPLDEFLATLRDAGIETLVDIRTAPGSRRHPQFGQAALREALASEGIAYVHLKELGGFRRASPDSPNTGLRNEAFRGYADHTASDEFAVGYRQLTDLASQAPTAYMCAETLWWRCHRRILSDRLALDGWEVLHLMRPGASQPHRVTPEARLVDGRLVYGLAGARAP